MKKMTHVTLAAVLVTALSLTGACANISNDRTRTQTEGGLAGAGIGAALGAVIGAAIDGHSGALTGALIGAGVGTAAGVAYGTSVADKKSEYASEEAWLAACLAEAQNVNRQAANYNGQLKTRLAGYNKEIGATGYSFNQAGQSDQQQPGQAIKRDLKESQQYLAYLDNEITSQQQAIASTGNNAQTKDIQKQVAEMEKQRQTLEQNNRELAAISNRIAM